MRKAEAGHYRRQVRDGLSLNYVVMPPSVRWHGACRTVPDPDIFFSQDQTNAAKAICEGCDVVEECRVYVDAVEGRTVTAGLIHGVWAGETARDRIRRRFRERKAVQRERERIAV